ncbi:MAG: peptide deformylase [Proteobacteria bacterium]|nr:peptide deformylase [Pseudomonadota bacterium]MCP4920457.1 peptide deformylase [Pseudomonadota bacterium]
MAILKVAQIGHPILRRVADPIPVEAIGTPAVQQLIQDMRDTLEEYDGAGLAAPQVHASVRVVITEVNDEPIVLINPVITPIGDDYCRTYEGCLSVKNMRAAVERPAEIRLQAYGEDGGVIDMELEDFNAVVTQHECDHLDGILYVDRMDPRTLAFLEEYRRWGPMDDFLYGEEGEE